nr:PIN domain-containing protein [uncultured Moellerella sp.]
MIKNVLLDANLLIAALDESCTTTELEKEAAKKQLDEILSDENIKIFITPLIRYEVLRGINWKDKDIFNQMSTILNGIPNLDITTDISELSANLFRFRRGQPDNDANGLIKLDKRSFDLMHFSTAKCSHCECISRDTDISKIEKIHQFYELDIQS